MKPSSASAHASSDNQLLIHALTPSTKSPLLALAKRIADAGCNLTESRVSSIGTEVSLMLLAWAWGRAEAHRLLPLEYSAFIWAALVGWLMFGEAVTLRTLGGVVLIVGGCLMAVLTANVPSDHGQPTLA